MPTSEIPPGAKRNVLRPAVSDVGLMVATSNLGRSAGMSEVAGDAGMAPESACARTNTGLERMAAIESDSQRARRCRMISIMGMESSLYRYSRSLEHCGFRSIGRRRLGLFDHHHFHRRFARLQLQPELLL